MAAYLAQPATQVSAYRPIKFKYESGSTTDLIEKLIVSVYNDETSTLIATYRKDWTSRTGSDPNYNYICEFDISGLVQSLLAPLPSSKSQALPAPDALNDYADDASLWVYVSCQWEKRNDDNLLEAVGTAEDSDVVYAFNLVQQHDEAQGLSEYVDTGARKVLHDPPAEGFDVRVTDSFFLSCILNQDIARARFAVLHGDGTTTNHNIPLSFASAAANHNKKVVSVNVGPYAANSFFSIAESDVSYTVFLADGSNTPLTETLTFNILPRCAGRDLRLHWMNERGGFDAYTFDGIKRRTAEVKSGSGEKPLVWVAGSVAPHDRNQRGKYRTDVRRADVWEVETRIIDEDKAEWLAGLLASPEVYVEQVGLDYYLPAMVIDGKITYADTEQVGAILKMAITLANEKFTPRN